MIRLLIVSFICLSVTACSNNKQIPETVLQPEKFQAVLTDVVLADAFNTERSFKDTGFKITDENAIYFLKVFQMHGITKNQFMQSYNFYLSRPDLLRVITDSVSSVLNRESLRLSIDTAKPKPNGNYSKQTRTRTGNK